MEITDGVYDLEQTVDLGERAPTIHPAAIERPDGGLVLVDTGYADRLAPLEDALAADGFALDDVEIVFLTHQDRDHAGNAAEIAQTTGADVYAHRDDAPVVEGAQPPVKGEADPYDFVPVDLKFVGGVELRTAAGPMRVVETPGHTPGHVSLYLPDEDLLLSGDAMTAEDGALASPVEGFTPEFQEAVDSVGALASLNPGTVLCFHGGLVEHADVPGLHRSLAAD